MRSEELLLALSQADGGVQVNVSRTEGCTVSTRYTPIVKGKGETLIDAATDCALKLLARIKSSKYFADQCQDVLSALRDYGPIRKETITRA